MLREWVEKQWKFKETASDEKMYTGHSYPAREYAFKVTLRDGRMLTGPLSAIIYVRAPSDPVPAGPAAGGAVVHPAQTRQGRTGHPIGVASLRPID